MPKNFRKKLYPEYKKRKKRIHPDDKPPEERYKNIRDAEQAVQDADMEEGNYLQDPENNTLAITAKDIEELTVKQKQQRDKIENAPKDKAIKATDKAHKAGNITDREHIENLKNAILSSIDINKAWEGARTVQNWKNPFDVAAAGTARTLEILKPDSWRDAQQNLIEMAAAGHPVKWAGSKLIREIPIVKKGLGKLDEATINLRRNLLASIKGDQILPDGTILKSENLGRRQTRAKTGKWLNTPDRTRKKILEDKITPTLEELDQAVVRGGNEVQGWRYDRSSVEGFSDDLAKQLQKEFGGTDAQRDAFQTLQKKAKTDLQKDIKALNKRMQFDYLEFANTAALYLHSAMTSQMQGLRRGAIALLLSTLQSQIR